MTATTQKAHLTRALLQSLAFRVQELLCITQEELKDTFDCIK